MNYVLGSASAQRPELPGFPAPARQRDRPAVGRLGRRAAEPAGQQGRLGAGPERLWRLVHQHGRFRRPGRARTPWPSCTTWAASASRRRRVQLRHEHADPDRVAPVPGPPHRAPADRAGLRRTLSRARAARASLPHAGDRAMTWPGAFADLQRAARMLASGGVRGRADRPAACTPTCSASRWCCGAARTASPGPAWTCACTGARRCRWAGSAATSWSAPTTAGGTGPTAGAWPSRSSLTRPGCRPRHGSRRSAARNGTGWSGWPWTSLAGRCPRCRNWRTASGRCSPPGPTGWQCDAARQVENFTDLGHFPWVHPGLLGDPDRPVVPRHEVRTEGHVLHYTIVRPEAPNSDDYPVFGNEQAGPPERTQPLRAAPAVHDRAAAGLGRRRAWCTSSRRSRSRPTTASATW